MLTLEIPGRAPITLNCLFLDYNGTIARDGKVLPGVKERLDALSEDLELYVLTADTFGSCRRECEDLPVEIVTFPKDQTSEIKEKIVKEHPGSCAIGNGQNDILMCKASALSIGILGEEGMASGLFPAVDVVVPGICEALDLLLKPLRLKATLRE